MYRHIIDIRQTVPKNVLETLEITASKAFDNRAGTVCNTSTFSHRFVFEGGEGEYGCLEVGMLALKREKLFMSCVRSWQWIDEDEPSESCDVLQILLESSEGTRA